MLWIKELIKLLENDTGFQVPNDGVLSPSFIIWLASLINWWKNFNIRFPFNVQSFLKRCNFDSIVNNGDVSKYTWWSDNLKEITLIKNWEDVNIWIISVDFLKIILWKRNEKNWDSYDNIASKIDQTLIVAFSEIVSNITIHSSADFQKNACMYMMQYYPSKKDIHISCVDNGIWIIWSLKNSKYKDDNLNDEEYLKLALSEWVTWDPREWQWNWLYQCSKMTEIIWWVFEIFTWNIYYHQIWQNKSYTYNDNAFPWTLVNIEMPLSKIETNWDNWKEFIWERWTNIDELWIYENLRS